MPDFQVNQLQLVRRQLFLADKEIRDAGQKELRNLGELVEHAIEARAPAAMRNVGMTPLWTQFKTGSVPRVVYVVPVKKGTNRRNNLRRPNFAREMKRDAMVPGLNSKRAEVNRRYQALVSKVCRDFNRG